MASMNISVPGPLRDWIESRLVGGRYATASEYLEDLIARDRADSEEREAVVAALEQGEASGESERRVGDILAALRREIGRPVE